MVQGPAAADSLSAPCRCKQSCRGAQSGLPIFWSSCTSTRHACCQAGRLLSRCAETAQAQPCVSPPRHHIWQQMHALDWPLIRAHYAGNSPVVVGPAQALHQDPALQVRKIFKDHPELQRGYSMFMLAVTQRQGSGCAEASTRPPHHSLGLKRVSAMQNMMLLRDWPKRCGLCGILTSRHLVQHHMHTMTDCASSPRVGINKCCPGI